MVSAAGVFGRDFGYRWRGVMVGQNAGYGRREDTREVENNVRISLSRLRPVNMWTPTFMFIKAEREEECLFLCERTFLSPSNSL